MLGVGTRKSLGIHKRVVGPQRATIAEIAQRSVGCAEPAAHDQFRRHAVRESYPRREVGFSAQLPRVRLETQSRLMLLRGEQGVECSGARHRAALLGHVVGSGGAVSANRNEVRLEAAGLSVRGEVIPPQAEIQSQPGSDLPIVLAISAPVPAVVVGSGNIGSGEAVHSSHIVDAANC